MGGEAVGKSVRLGERLAGVVGGGVETGVLHDGVGGRYLWKDPVR